MKRIASMRVMLAALPLALMTVSCSHRSPSPGGTSARGDTAAGNDSVASQTSAVRIDYTYEQREGKFLYAKYCAVCHGDGGKGDGFNAFNLNPKPRDFSDSAYMSALTDQKIAETIAGGGRGVGKSPQMPSWGGRLTKAEVLYVTEYVRTFRGR